MRNFEIKEMKGDELISQGVELDTFKNPILVDVEYQVRLYHKKKTMTIIKKADQHRKEMYETVNDIKAMDGIINWFNQGCRLGFIEDVNSFAESVEGMIEFFDKLEDYESSNYLKDELSKLKKSGRV